MSHTTINNQRQFEEFCRRLTQCPRIAFDTEFVAERTYRPVLCLIQVAAGDELALIDTLVLDNLNPFWEAICEPGHETIVHAGRGEFEFCYRAIRQRPAGLFDVQIAAGLAGLEYPVGLGNLLQRILGIASSKAETRTDWRRRPLGERQISYALDDVRYLHPICDELHARLQSLGRAAWLEEEMALWQDDVENALSHERWQKVSGNSGLDPRSLAILRELWRWREGEAERRDCPVRRVLRDDLLVELARRKSDEPRRIRAVRGLERGDLKRFLPAIAEAVGRALHLPDTELPTRAARNPMPQLAVLGQFLFSALGSICRQMNLAPSLVGTPSDVRDLIAHGSGCVERERPPRLSRGWRAEVVGNTFDDLLSGKKAIRITDPASDHPLSFEPSDP